MKWQKHWFLNVVRQSHWKIKITLRLTVKRKKMASSSWHNVWTKSMPSQNEIFALFYFISVVVVALLLFLLLNDNKSKNRSKYTWCKIIFFFLSSFEITIRNMNMLIWFCEFCAHTVNAQPTDRQPQMPKCKKQKQKITEIKSTRESTNSQISLFIVRLFLFPFRFFYSSIVCCCFFSLLFLNLVTNIWHRFIQQITLDDIHTLNSLRSLFLTLRCVCVCISQFAFSSLHLSLSLNCMRLRTDTIQSTKMNKQIYIFDTFSSICTVSFCCCCCSCVNRHST